MNPALHFVQLYENYQGTDCQQRSFSRGEFLTRSCEIERHIYVILKGGVRAFYVSDKEEFTIRFGYKDSIINSLASFVSQQPSDLYLQALRSTEVKMIPRAPYFDFVHSSFEILKMHNELMTGVVVSQLERELDLLTTSPLGRYERVLERSPQLFQEIPLKYIASYLRMTPETLSRLRSS